MLLWRAEGRNPSRRPPAPLPTSPPPAARAEPNGLTLVHGNTHQNFFCSATYPLKRPGQVRAVYVHQGHAHLPNDKAARPVRNSRVPHPHHTIDRFCFVSCVCVASPPCTIAHTTILRSSPRMDAPTDTPDAHAPAGQSNRFTQPTPYRDGRSTGHRCNRRPIEKYLSPLMLLSD